jgi:hypothetical protein
LDGSIISEDPAAHILELEDGDSMFHTTLPHFYQLQGVASHRIISCTWGSGVIQTE